MCSNRAEFIESFLGCAWLGAIAVPINVASRGPQLRHILSNSGARLLVIEAELLNALDHVDMNGLGARADLADRRPSFDTVRSDCRHQRATACARPSVRALSIPRQLLAILYTSGTTGPSKGVCCPHAQYFWWGVNGIRNLEIREGDVLCTTLPLFHTNALGTFYQALLTGSTLVAEPRFSASRFWQSLIDHRATATYVLGAMVPILLSRNRRRRSKAITCAAAWDPACRPISTSRSSSAPASG